MKYSAILATALLLAACSEQPETDTDSKADAMKTAEINYPETARGDVVDNYFGVAVADPYRWLEDDRSAETEDWVKRQNEVTFAYLEQIAYRDDIRQRLETLWNYEKQTRPKTAGGYLYFKKNDGLQNQYVVYRQDKDGNVELFLDPNSFSEDGTTSLDELSFSRDGSLAAYSISEGGSDWRKIIVIDAETRRQLEEPLVDVKFSSISWYGNEGFYYSSYDKPDGSELSAKTDQHKLYYHKVGTSQSEDKVVFGASEDQKHRYVGADVSDDDRYLFIAATNATTGNKLFVKDLSDPDSELVTVQGEANADTTVLTSVGSTLYLETNLDAPNKRVVTVDVSAPLAENWVDIIPETGNVLNPTAAANYIFAEYMVDAISQVKQYDLSGKLVRDIELPGIGSVAGFDGKKSDTLVYYTFENYNTPDTIIALDPVTGKSWVHAASQAKFDSTQYVSNQVFFASKDGTRVPMIITHHKDLQLDGNNPTILYGYGGFNVSQTPSFGVSVAAWLEMGGIYAFANIRGGGEYGQDWHIAGTKQQKQNVFDDFIAAGEYLIEKGYTSSDRLAISGGSNGGLLVGAVMTQRPDLARVALPAVGVLDMLRYHTFTAGAGWAYDYGTAEDSKEMFEYLRGYSPVHNVREGVSYPATMITTADHDDRVVPAHSFKFAAELQAKDAGQNPMLIRIETKAGHGAGTPVSKTIEKYADVFSFTLYNMGIRELPKRQ